MVIDGRVIGQDGTPGLMVSELGQVDFDCYFM